MKIRLIKIGNSQGIRIPKALIEQCGLGDGIELQVEGDALVLRGARAARAGWAEALTRASDEPEETLLPDHMSEVWDESEWTW